MSKKRVAVLLATGFEEAKTAIVVGIMHRLDIGVEMLTCHDRLEIIGQHHIRMFGDALLERRLNVLYDAVIIPGGDKAATLLAVNPEVIGFIQRHQLADKLICAIGSAAGYVLAANHLLQDHRYVCSGDPHLEYGDGVYVDQNLVEDRNIISSKGLGTALDFALTIAGRLTGDKKAVAEQAEQIHYEQW